MDLIDIELFHRLSSPQSALHRHHIHPVTHALTHQCYSTQHLGILTGKKDLRQPHNHNMSYLS